ncbi:uncharacterized protein LOC129737963 isoform X2 [Uranotaenia lowii]|nr:uncharacterized protein LOC129737963 isoform X2 [Uranotaenia lowii]
MEKVPHRNPVRYCRLCLSQNNLLTVIDLQTRMQHRELLDRLYDYLRIAFEDDDDFPSAICDLCTVFMDEFHAFQQTATRNHQMVKLFRKDHGDVFSEDDVARDTSKKQVSLKLKDFQWSPFKMDDSDPENEFPSYVKEENEDEFYVDVLDLTGTEIKQEIPSPQKNSPAVEGTLSKTIANELVKNVDVYHMDGELQTVVVKEETVETSSVLPVLEQLSVKPQLTIKKVPKVEPGTEPATIDGSATEEQITTKTSPANMFQRMRNVTVKPVPARSVGGSTATKRPPPGRLLNAELCDKRPKIPPSTVKPIIKCNQCRAVFSNETNLLMHMENDHSPNKPKAVPRVAQLPKNPGSQQSKLTLFKCTHCNSSFVQLRNYQEHQANQCKEALRTRFPAGQEPGTSVTVKQYKAPTTPTSKPRAANESSANKSDRRLPCPYCKNVYKSEQFLNRHLFEVHKVLLKREQHRCDICQLNYSCREDLALHHRAMHQCRQCGKNTKDCNHGPHVSNNSAAAATGTSNGQFVIKQK